LEVVRKLNKTDRNDSGATAVVALSTALIMDIPDIVDKILDHVAMIENTHIATEVSLFETTIRYVGGMLSAYDLLKGPLSGVASNVNATGVHHLRNLYLPDLRPARLMFL
jgi:mannosyl-oligosaccharide alpha-1,2-mannosidase